LPDGTQIVTSYSGIVNLNNFITLFDVLYTPKFKVNLISVTKLTTNLNCFLEIHPHLCFIKQMPDFKMIGLAKPIGGLLVVIKHFCEANEIKNQHDKFGCNVLAANKEDSTLWHYRLGHISKTQHQIISSQFPYIPQHFISPCDTCQMSK